MARPAFLPALLGAATLLFATTLPAEDAMTGSFRMTYKPADIVEPEFAKALVDQKIFKKKTELQWQVYVPESYSKQKPAGVLVFIDPDGHGRVPDPWQPVLDRHNLIWVGVRQTERKTSDAQRVWQAVLGSRALEKDYAIDLERLYVGGSDDTVPSALNTMLMVNDFAGAIYIRGSVFSPALASNYQQAMQRKYHVFMTGTDDLQKDRIRGDHDAYLRNGFYNSKLIFDTQRLGPVPKPELLDEAVGFFDARFVR